jgi:hypothetical protein
MPPGVEIRAKRDHSALMHLKSHQIDGRLLRSGAMGYLLRFVLAILAAAGEPVRAGFVDLIQIRDFFRTSSIFPNLRSAAKARGD